MKYDETARAIFERRARAIAELPARSRTARAPVVPHLLFSVQGERLALPLHAVRAFVRSPNISRFPEAGEAVRGIMPFEGAVVTVLALERLLGHPRTATNITAAVVLDTPQLDVAIAIEVEEGLADIDLSGLARGDGLITGTLLDGRGILDASAVADNPRGMMTKQAADDVESEGIER